MDVFQIILGRYLLEFLGALLRFLYLNIKQLILNKGNFISFSKLWSPKINEDKKTENEMTNHMIGAIVLMLFVFLLIITTPRSCK